MERYILIGECQRLRKVGIQIMNGQDGMEKELASDVIIES